VAVSAALQATANGLVNATVLAGGALYLLYLDARVFAALLVLAAASFAVYRMLSERARALLRRARAEHDRLFSHLRAMTEGAKELKLHAGRRRAFLDGPLRETTESLVEHSIRGNARYLFIQAINSLLVLTAIGAALFGASGSGAAGPGVASGYVLAALYLTGPLSSLLRLLPVFAAAEIALQRIRDTGVELGRGTETEPDADPGASVVFDSVELREVTHRYDEGAAFTLGPLSLRITPGEIVFITGGNGSGKSTLARILVGLYEPGAGQVMWDGETVSTARRDTYRQLFSAVFSEFHVFDRLYGLQVADADVRALLAELGLTRAVHVQDGTLSSIDLSRGQRKRLALLTALLENRPIYVFDEWAADQDPDFKQHFYRRLLPQLRRRGKAVVVISHDDRWFDVADRVLQLRDGQLAAEAQSTARAQPASA